MSTLLQRVRYRAAQNRRNAELARLDSRKAEQRELLWAGRQANWGEADEARLRAALAELLRAAGPDEDD